MNMNSSVITQRSKNGALSIGKIILYNLAGFSFNLYDTILYAWLPYFYAPPEGSGLTPYISLTVFAAILAGGRILDAVSDPLIGYLSDNTRSRWGRRKPYIFISMPILFITFILVWNPPVKGISSINIIFLASSTAILFRGQGGIMTGNIGHLTPARSTLPSWDHQPLTRLDSGSLGVQIVAWPF